MKKKYLILLILVLVGINTKTANALTVSPARIEITADPGQSIQGEVELLNEQKEEKIFYTSYENFESRGDTGAPYFTGDKSGLATWISTDTEVNLAPDERKTVPYTITVPKDAKPGGYFAALFFGNQPENKNGGSEVVIGGKIGILILLRVSGDVDESAGITDFGTEGGKRFFSTLPIVFTYGFNNIGGDRVIPRGNIKINNLLHIRSVSLLANKNEGSVLPQSTRRFTVSWGGESKEKKNIGFLNTVLAQIKDFHIGWYTANIDLTWGASSQNATKTYHFFVIPWQLISIILIATLVFWRIILAWFKRMKRRIIHEAINGNRQ